MTTERAAEHTPEPWHAIPDDPPEDTHVVIEAEGYVLCELMQFGHGDDPRIPNARRIVACVNACKGWSNEALEKFAAGDDEQLAREFAARLDVALKGQSA